MRGETWFTVDKLAHGSGIPLVMLEAAVRNGMLVPHRVPGLDRYSHGDVADQVAAERAS